MAEPPESTVVPESIGLVLLPIQGRASSGQRESRRSRGAMWAAITRQGMVSPRGSSPSLRRGCDDDAEPAAADILAVDLDVDR